MTSKKTILEVTRDGDALESLRALAEKLAAEIDIAEPRDLAALSRQYRETLKAIGEMDGDNGYTDEITQIITKRKATR